MSGPDVAPARDLAPADPLAAALPITLATQLATDLDLHTVADLLGHLPLRYREAGELGPYGDVVDGTYLTLTGTVRGAEERTTARGRGERRSGPRRIREITIDAGAGRQLAATYFNHGPAFAPGARVLLYGKVGIYRHRLQLTHPDHLVLDPGPGGVVAKTSRATGCFAKMLEAGEALGEDAVASLLLRTLVPVYRGSGDSTTWLLLPCIDAVLARLGTLDDPLDEQTRAERGLCELDVAYRAIHQPADLAQLDEARARLRFDEALAIQLALARRRGRERARTAPACPPVAGGVAAAFAERLPFTLTAGQEAVAREVRADLSTATPMNRLLQGEVGSGKTVVALQAMLQVVDAGRQCVLLAPTEVLAAQHLRSISAMLGDLAGGGELGADPLATTVTLLTGAMSIARRRQALLDIASGTAGIVIGTHALIQDGVDFFDLGLVVVDEQHRFGVRQRDHLREKGRDGVVPHFLVMTATPIPRTIAMTLFGDLDVSTLREVPAGRGEVSTVVVPYAREAWMTRLWERVREEVAAGGRVYVVCARIGDEKNAGGPGEPVGVTAMYARLRAEALRGLRLGLLHGRLAADDKDATMASFARGEIDVLVATTVIEVGVDVPAATVMVIMDADRFGVSQLHQLRGRIGRGSRRGLCLLVTGRAPDEDAYRRLERIAQLRDGFALADLDLLTRHEGDVLGEAQSGLAGSLRLLRLTTDQDVIEDAHAVAARFAVSDPEYSHAPELRLLADVVEGEVPTALRLRG